MPLNANAISTGWKLAGAAVGLLALGASGMAATVNAKLQTHIEQEQEVIFELRAIHHLVAQQLCIQLAIEPKLSCLQK